LGDGRQGSIHHRARRILKRIFPVNAITRIIRHIALLDKVREGHEDLSLIVIRQGAKHPANVLIGLAERQQRPQSLNLWAGH
jgi:hypothetical protein